MSTPISMPLGFISHGAPSIALAPESDYARALAGWARRVPEPDAIVVMSAHWEVPGPVRVTSGPRPPVIYDFGGFPEPLYKMSYPAPGAPGLAAEIVALLSAAGVPAAPDEHQGWDHGVWIPLHLTFPRAEIPVVEVSLLSNAVPEEILRVGRALVPLRRRRVLMIGSGGIVHNLGRLRFDDIGAPVDDWADRFDRWVRGRLGGNDVAALAAYRELAPDAALSVPTQEHFNPLFFVLGAMGETDRVTDIHESFQYGNLSMRCFEVS